MTTCTNCARRAVNFFGRLMCSACSMPCLHCSCEPIGPTILDALLPGARGNTGGGE
jgi:hypothetical protein